MQEFSLIGAGLYNGNAGFEADDPHSFSIRLSEGNWQVTLAIGDEMQARETTVKAESRRLMIDRLVTGMGEFIDCSFIVNIRSPILEEPPQNAPGGASVALKPSEISSRNWDGRLTLEFSDPSAIRSIRIAPAQVPTIYLVGDSTVADQPFEPAASWGQMLPVFTLETIAIANHAESGETLKSFLSALRLAKVLSQMRKGDFLFIQFGHNDQKVQWPQTYADPERTYPAYLNVFIEEARARGAVPVLVTPPERRNYNADGSVQTTLSDYADAMRQIAKEKSLPLIDLNRYSCTLYSELGENKAAELFNDGGADRTHHNNAGAWMLAAFVALDASKQVPGLSKHLKPISPRGTRPAFEYAQGLFPSVSTSSLRPDGN